LEPRSVFVTAVQSELKASWTDNEDNSDPSSSISSRQSATGKNVILQLSPSGGLHPMPVHSHETDETTSETTVSIFRVHWDFDPLFQHVLSEGTLLPLHIACFYSASSDVLKAVANAYPVAALCDVVGMLPIHWVAAGWNLPPLLPPPASPLPSQPKPGPLEVLKVLQHTVPDSIRIRSGNHGMTPEDYIQECMDDCEYKELCLRALLLGKDILDDGSVNSSDETIVFSSDTSSADMNNSVRTESVSCISILVAERDWEGMLAAVEDDPSIATKWIYGIDEMASTVWKRLPIHLACAYGAPVGLVSILLRMHPLGASAVDPHDGSTPLHLACQARASLGVVKLLLDKCPEATKADTLLGRRALHMAVLSMASYDAIEALVEVEPASVSVVDNEGKTPMDYAKLVYGEHHIVYELLTMIFLFLDKSYIM
jgi:Ankyrin repeats (3 copies)